MVTYLVTGGTGFVGSRLAKRLLDDGATVKVMTRRPETYAGPGVPVYGDSEEPDSLKAASEGVDVAYYLIHSLDDDNFERKDAEAARAFALAAATHGVNRIVYLGGLGSDEEELSPHLRSRRQVESLLAQTGVPVTVLRAAVIVGHGGASWEITRQLVENLPAMVAPPWAKTRTQPIGIDDVIRYLLVAGTHPEAENRVFEIGGTDQLAYLDMVQVAAELIQGKALPALTIPMPAVFATAASAAGLSVITDVDATTAKHLIDSMGVEVLVTDHSIRELSPELPMSYREQVERALVEREESLAHGADHAG